jgi:hypothetical protein
MLVSETRISSPYLPGNGTMSTREIGLFGGSISAEDML